MRKSASCPAAPPPKHTHTLLPPLPSPPLLPLPPPLPPLPPPPLLPPLPPTLPPPFPTTSSTHSPPTPPPTYPRTKKPTLGVGDRRYCSMLSQSDRPTDHRPTEPSQSRSKAVIVCCRWQAACLSVGWWNRAVAKRWQSEEDQRARSGERFSWLQPKKK